jgi:hypothetical protein
MSDLKKQLSSLSNSENATAGLYTLFIGMALGNLIPTPSDALYMLYQTKLRDKWKRGLITPEQYWKRNAIGYYFIPFTWWVLLGAIVVNIKGTSEKKAKIALALIGSSAVVGLILKQIQKDNQEINTEDEAKLKLLREHPEVLKILNKPEFDSINGQFRNITGEQLKKKHEDLKHKN